MTNQTLKSRQPNMEHKRTIRFRKLLLITGLLSLAISNPIFANEDFLGYEDINEKSPSFQAVQWLQKYKKIDNQKNFHPDQLINRAEFIRMIIGNDELRDTRNCYQDVSDQWYAPYICTAKVTGGGHIYESGTYYSPDYFHPGAEVTFTEAGSRMMQSLELVTPGYPDNIERLYEFMSQCRAIPNSVQHVDQSLTRGEAATIFYRMIICQMNTSDPTHEYTDLFESFESKDYKDLKFFPIIGNDKLKSPDLLEALKTQEFLSYCPNNPPLILQNNSYLVLYNQSQLSAFDKKTGETISSHFSPGKITTPILEDSILYFANEYEVLAINLKSQKKVWSFYSDKDYISRITIDNDHILVDEKNLDPSNQEHRFILNKSTGSLIQNSNNSTTNIQPSIPPPKELWIEELVNRSCDQEIRYDAIRPIGWSNDGKIAYIIDQSFEPPNQKNYQIVIQDLVTDEILWNKQDNQSLVKTWINNQPELQAQFQKYQIKPQEKWQVDFFPFNHNNQIYNQESNTQFLLEQNTKLYLTRVSKSDYQKKLIYNHQSNSEKNDSANTRFIKVIGTIKSPYENRIAIIVTKIDRTEDNGPPNLYQLSLIGADLENGFSAYNPNNSPE